MASSSCTVLPNSLNENDHAETSSSTTPNSDVATVTPNSPWQCKNSWSKNSLHQTVAVSFEDVMSEQLASELQKENDIIPSTVAENSSVGSPPVDESIVDTSSDAILAQILQAQMDREHNESVSNHEAQVNKNSKVKLVFRNHRTDEMFVSNQEDDDDDEDFSDDEITNITESDPNTNLLDIKNIKGYVVFGKKIVTKHDSELCGRRNTARLEDSFPVQFRTGDATGLDIQLNNRIYNSLKKHAFSEQKRGQRLHETKQNYTAEHALDERTRLILHRFVDRGIIASVNGVISIGKEAVVVHADGGDVVASDLSPSISENSGEKCILQVPQECALKIYKTTLNEFKTRDDYIKEDYRFKDRFKKLNPRKIIHMWAEKEMHNLIRMTKAGIACPEVVLLKKHVLIMSFIGRDQQPAPKLKSAILSSSEKKRAYAEVVDMMKKLFHQCKLIHADLSEYNLLWYEKKVWMIDVSQSVEPSHPHGLEFLHRDCINISKFFNNLGVPDVLSPMHLFNAVSGLNIPTEDQTSFIEAIKTMQSSAEEHAQQGRMKSSQIFDQTAN